MTTQTKRPRGRPPLAPWHAWDAKLGTVPDRVIAEAVGLTQAAVALRRAKLGIRPFGKNHPETVYN